MRTFRENAAWNGMVWPANVSGDLTTWTYDAASGLVTSKTDAKGKSVNYTYTVDGKLASRTWARGIVTNYTYDSATGKLLKADYSDTTPDITYTYNRSGQIATIQDAAGSRTFTYDNTFNLEFVFWSVCHNAIKEFFKQCFEYFRIAAIHRLG